MTNLKGFFNNLITTKKYPLAWRYRTQTPTKLVFDKTNLSLRFCNQFPEHAAVVQFEDSYTLVWSKKRYVFDEWFELDTQNILKLDINVKLPKGNVLR